MINFFANLLDINQATLSGAIDIVVVKQPNNKLVCTPFHIRFGKLKLLKTQEKLVSVHINNEETDLAMKLGSAGEAYFVHEKTVSSVARSGELDNEEEEKVDMALL